MQPLRKAIIPAAGLGTRFLPATKAIPKEMLPIVDKPVIQYVVEEAVESGLRDILFVTSQGKSAIADHFDYNFELDVALKQRGRRQLRETVEAISRLISVSTIRQKEPLGLGHAILTTEPYVGSEPFAVFLGDDIIINPIPAMHQMLDVWDQYPGTMVAVQEVPPEAVNRYGIVKVEKVEGLDRLFRVTDMIEKPSRDEAPSNLAIIGRYIVMPEIFGCLRRTRPGANGEIQLTDGIRRLAEMGEDVFAFQFEGNRYDAGDKLEFLIATVELALQREEIGESFRQYLRGLRF